MCLPIRLPAHVFFTIMKFHNNEIHNNERTPWRVPEPLITSTYDLPFILPGLPNIASLNIRPNVEIPNLPRWILSFLPVSILKRRP